MYIMTLSIQTKKGRNLRCIFLQYNKEDTIEKEKDLRRQFQSESGIGSDQGREDDFGDCESV